jgi:N utilization substance protein B
VTNIDPGGAGANTQRTNVARSAARLNAVQALYQMAISGGTAEAIIRQFASTGPNGRIDEDDGPIAEADNVLFADLVRGTRGKLAEVDEMLLACLDEAWPADRMEILLRAVLRCGAYELLSQPAVPARVVISEYVRVADAFFDGKEPSLVNAVLDRLARVLRPEELAQPGNRQ